MVPEIAPKLPVFATRPRNLEMLLDQVAKTNRKTEKTEPRNYKDSTTDLQSFK